MILKYIKMKEFIILIIVIIILMILKYMKMKELVILAFIIMMSLAVLLKFRPIYIHEINNIYSILNQTHYILLLMIKLYIGIIIFNCIIIFIELFIY
jgi:hypothetical protein